MSTDTTQQIDNIEPVPEKQKNLGGQVTSVEKITPVYVSEFYSIKQIGEAISHHYKRGFKDLRFTPPSQIIDGSVVDFIDGETGIIVATARLRFKNTIGVDKSTGAINVDLAMSDLTFIERAHVSFATNLPHSN